MKHVVPNRATRIGWWLLLLLLLVAGCGANISAPRPAGPLPTPTVAAMFNPVAIATPAPIPTSAPVSFPPREVDPDKQFEEIVIYDEELRAGWSLEQSSGVRYDTAVSGRTYSGSFATSITPLQEAGEFFLTVERGAQEVYTRDQVIGVSFWLNGGPFPISNDSLVMAVVGSNDYTYWVENDPSIMLSGRVTQADAELFSPTRLYYLGVNRTVPANQWVEVINWLDDRIYDVDYKYITGMYIRSDRTFFNPFYIDRITLLVER